MERPSLNRNLKLCRRKQNIESASLHLGSFAVAHTKKLPAPEATNLIIKHCMVVGAALHFTVVTFWATQSVVERPVSAASCTPHIVVLSNVVVVVDVVASAVSVVLDDNVVGIALVDLV